jgi:glucokinase
MSLVSRPRTLEGTKEALLSLMASIQKDAPGRIRGVGLATAGPLDHRTRQYLQTSNMPELNFFRVGDFISRETGLAVAMENDGQAAALGETWQGCLAGEPQAVVITLGTGVGSGVIMDGRIWRANHFTGPELGHLYLGPGRGKRCGCGQVGCAETWLNREALLELFLDEGLAGSDLREFHQAVVDKDPRAAKVMGRYGRRLGLFISSLQVVFGTQSVGLSGGLSAYVPYCQQHIWATLKKRFEHRSWWLPERVVASSDPEMSALLGMARILILKEGGQEQ